MKTYPSIPRVIVDQPVYAFDKLDGSNIRAEWSRKQGFYKFGTRKRLLGEDDPLLGEARSLVLDGPAEALEKVFRANRWQKAVAFFEFFGDNSFAGLHEDEPHKVVLIDVAYEKKGIMPPKEFLKTFESKVETAPLLYHGKPNKPFVESVQTGQLENMTFEGVVCKGKLKSPGLPLMFKVKNQAWVDEVKTRYSGREDLDDLL
jgi:hypothetical protein